MKKLVFKIFAVALPLLFIIVLEVVLRAVDYGDNYQPFAKVRGENGVDYLMANPNLSKKYFGSTNFHSDSQSDLFLKKKTDSTFRIVVQGASTVVGYPFYRGGSFPRMLKQRLSRTFPQKNIEVVNTAITAVNSYTLWDITDNIIGQEPDLVIIYAGHNEYYGALGVGSSASVGSYPFLVRSYLKLKNFRFFQLLENGSMALTGAASNKKGLPVETTLMETMAKEQEIPMDSKTFNAGIQQFRSNMERILEKYQQHGIPVILSTLVSNEKDVKPFISAPLDLGDYQSSLMDNFDKAYDLAQKNANAAYAMGKYYLTNEQRPDSAKKYLHLAKELDLLRFRAPDKINEAIVQMAHDFDLPLVDMQKVFRSLEPNGIMGNELLAEHVHPNVKGYFVMADAFYEKIRELGLLKNWDHYISYQDAYNDIPISKIDSIKGNLVVTMLKESWPYKLQMSGRKPSLYDYLPQKLSFEEQKAVSLYNHQEQWQYVMTQAYHRYVEDGDYKNALKVAQTLLFEFPEQYKVYEMAAAMCLKLQDTSYAGFYAQKGRYLRRETAIKE